MERIALTSVNDSSSMKQTTCPYCGVGCGVDVQLEKRDGVTVPVSLNGTPEHPANFGRLCVKGSQLLGTLNQTGRLTAPEVYGEAVSWDQATEEVASRFRKIIDEHGPDSVAFYVSGQLLTEDYYVANKLMKGYIGSANIDTNSRLCMSSAVAAHKRAFGADTVPASYEDLEQADAIVFVGSNAAWTHPVLFQRIERARKLNPDLKLVFVDPRKTASCEQADLHVQIRSGSDVALFNGLLAHLSKHDFLDQAFIDASVDGLDVALDKAAPWTIDAVAQACGITTSTVGEFFDLFAKTEKVISFFSMGVNQSSSGVDKANAIINCHLATGKIGKPGCAPLSITGQPNAMGGREVGGLANLLASHLDIANPEHRDLVQEYWGSPTISPKAGLKAVDLFEQIEAGSVKAVWVMATNPLVSMPNRNQIERALQNCELVVVSDFVEQNDTLSFADIKLPATSWSEKDGTVTNSERTISRQRGFLEPLGDARHDWQIICDVARKMGYDGFDFRDAHEVFEEYCGLTAYKNNGSRLLDLSGLMGMSEAEYDALRPIQWPVTKQKPAGTKRLFEDGQFCTDNGKARCIALDFCEPEQATSNDFPFVLNTGRLRDQWHTMTRTGINPELSQHVSKAHLSMHPQDAEDLGLSKGQFVALTSSVSKEQDVVLPLELDRGLRRGELFAPIHWGKAVASSASVAHLFTSAKDAMSGQPELKHAAVALAPVDIDQRIELVTRERIANEWLMTHAEIWTEVAIAGGYRYTIANREAKNDFCVALNALLPNYEERISHQTAFGSQVIALEHGAVCYLVFVSSQEIQFERAWVESLLGADQLSDDQVRGVIYGEPEDTFKQGRTVCSCFKVGEKTIEEAIKTQGCSTVDALGKALKCGTNCGSCKPELQQLIHEHASMPEPVVMVEGVA